MPTPAPSDRSTTSRHRPRPAPSGPGRIGASLVLAVALLVGLMTASSSAAPAPTVRFATFNASLNRSAAGQLAENLAEPYDGTDPSVSDQALRRWQAANVAEVLQRTRPDVVLINEFDYDPDGAALQGFVTNYLAVGQNGADPIEYPYTFSAPSNTGVASGVDLNNSGTVGGPDDAFGFGFYPGQYGMVVLSRYPIDLDAVRTFQQFRWDDMPDNLLPYDYYSPESVEVLRLSSKSHWDLPIVVDTSGNGTVHFLVSHPTPPVFDGPEDRNGRRNHDEIRFWADYVQPARSGYIYDDEGNHGGLAASARFVIAGDQNADPLDGDSTDDAIGQLLTNPRIADPRPSSEGAVEASALQGGANADHLGDPRYDTADFADGSPGNLRADYVLPSRSLRVVDTGVFWPPSADPLSRLTGAFDFGQYQRDGIGFPTSDHRLVWLDVAVPPGGPRR